MNVLLPNAGAEMARAVLAEDCQLLRGHLQDSERIREVLERKVRDLKAELVEQGSQLESLQASSAQNTSRMEAAHRDVLQWKEKVRGQRDILAWAAVGMFH